MIFKFIAIVKIFLMFHSLRCVDRVLSLLHLVSVADVSTSKLRAQFEQVGAVVKSVVDGKKTIVDHLLN